MEMIVDRLSSIINTPERYEIAIDIYYNFDELIRSIKIRFFDKIKEKVQAKYGLDEGEWKFFYQDNEHFCLFKHSWQFDKSDRGIYSFILHNNDGSGLVRNNWYDPKNLTDEEQAIVNIISNYKGMHSYKDGDGWWLLYKKPNPFIWSAQDYKKICDQESHNFKGLLDECVDRIDDLLKLIKETNLEKAIDECIEARKKSNKI